MSSFRNYSDAGAYRTRTASIGGGSSTLGRNTSVRSSFSNYRSNYTGIGSTSIKPTTTAMKERSIGSSYANKGTEKERLTPIKTSSTDSRPTSRCSSRASTSSYSYSDYKDKEPLSYRSLRAASVEPATNNKAGAYRVTYSRTPTFGRSTNSPNIVESATLPRYTGSSSNSRYSIPAQNNPERLTGSIGYTEKFRSPMGKSASPALHEDIPKTQQCQNGKTRTYEEKQETHPNVSQTEEEKKDDKSVKTNNEAETKEDNIMVVTVVTRGTSPTPPPALTAYTRTKRLEPIPKPVRRVIKKSEYMRKIVQEQEQQTDRSDDPSRDKYSKYSSGPARVPWVSSYLEKFGTANSGTASSSYSRGSYRAGNSYGYRGSSEHSSKDSSSRSTPSHDGEQRSRSSSSPGSLRGSGRSSPKVDTSQKRCSGEDDKSFTISREASPRIVEGQDHGQSSNHGSRKESSLSQSSNISSSSNHSKSGNVPRSGSLKSRQPLASEASPAVSMPTGCRSTAIGGKLASSAAAASSSSSSSSVANSNSNSGAAVTSMSKIKSAGTTSTSSNNTSNSSSSSSSLPTSSGAGKSGVSTGSQAVGSRQATPPDARKPPVPKSGEMVGKSGGLGPGVSGKYINKDFRKSALNMENGDPSRSQIAERKHQKKVQRSVSVSSQDSQSENNSSDRQQASLRSAKLSKSRTPTLKSLGSGSKADQKSSGIDVRRSSSQSPSSSVKNARVSRTMSTGSECSSNATSSESSNSDEDDDRERNAKTDARNRRTSDSPFQGKMSRGSSRTSVLASSADELSTNTDRPPKPPPSPRCPRSDSSDKNEEAKSFLMRALAPVTNLFKTKTQDNGAEIRNGGWADVGSEENSDSGKNSKKFMSKTINPATKSPSFTNAEKATAEEKKRTGLRHESSEEKPWWLDPNSDNVPEGVERNPCLANDDISQDTTASITLPDDGKFKFKVWRQDSEERAWWLDDNDNNIPDEELSCSAKEPAPAASPIPTANLSQKNSPTPGRSNAQRSNPCTTSSKSQKTKRASRLKHQQSGERAWWMGDDPESVPEGIEVIPVSPVAPESQDSSTSQDKVPIGRRIRHIESGEQPWWMDSSSNVPEGIRQAAPETSNSTSDSSESFEKIEIGLPTEKRISPGAGFAKFPVDYEPLGDRASPEGVENPPDPPDNYGGRSSPYDNVSSKSLTPRQTPPRRSAPRKRPANLPLFISSHTNIDDLLGNESEPSYSPDRSGGKRQQRYSGDMANNGRKEKEEEEEEELREVDATQVIIHDSTPQTPVIKRRHRDSDRPQPDGYIPYWAYMPEAPFAPVIEKAGFRPFINKSPEEIAEANEMNDVPLIFGTVSNEGCDPGAGVCRCDDVLLVTDHTTPYTKNKQELQILNLLVDMWESVAISGIPNVGVDWHPVNASDSKIKYLHIAGPGNYKMSENSNLGEKHF